MISFRSKNVPPSPIRRLIPYAEEAKRRGIKVYHLNIGQPDIPTPEAFWEGIRKYKEKVLSYGPSDGLRECKKAVREYYNKIGIEIMEEEIFITTGGSEGILFIFFILGEVGDEFLIPEPCYANYISLGRMAQINLVPIETKVEEGFHLPEKKEIEKLITKKTKAIIICSPNNPTGTVYSREEINRIVELGIKYNLFLILDEVYREFLFDGREWVNIFTTSFPMDRIIIIDSLSKRFSACGARIGFIVTKNKQILSQLMVLGMARLCPPTIGQMGAIESFKKMDEFMGEMIEEYERRRNIVYEELKKIKKITTYLPEGAFYTIAKLPVEDAEEFIKWLLTSFHLNGRTVMVAPLDGFYLSQNKGKNEIRIAYVLEEERLKEAMLILRKGLEEYGRITQ